MSGYVLTFVFWLRNKTNKLEFFAALNCILRTSMTCSEFTFSALRAFKNTIKALELYCFD